MAMSEWITNLFQSEQTRGLSGGVDSAIALDESNSYYNFRLRRHSEPGDIIADPSLLWRVADNTGLGAHIEAERSEGRVGFTDVLLLLSLEDYTRAIATSGEPWPQRASNEILRLFHDYCARTGTLQPFPNRQLGVRILCDGSADMGGRSLGLRAGEFVTGLLPNGYTGPVRGSKASIGIHMNLPGVWEGYQEIGRLYSDQLLFTLGNHWLDNFTHPALREAALYRLQHDGQGGFVHVINPDLQDRYTVTASDQGGASVLTLQTRDGDPVAYMVLAVVEDEARPRPSADFDDPFIAAPMLIDDELQPLDSQALSSGSKTILPDAPSERIFTLQERGALLQRVHFGAFMLGYDVYLGRRGELGTVVLDPSVTFQIRKDETRVIAHTDNVTLSGAPLLPGLTHTVTSDVTLRVGDEVIEYRDLRGVDIEGWPYVGEIRRPASSSYLVWGREYTVGRSRDSRIVLPDEPRNDNIHWKPSVGDGAMIRARSGDIPKAKFYTDSIMVSSEHAAFDLTGDRPSVVCKAGSCYVFVRRKGQILPLYPTRSDKGEHGVELVPNDEILIGNQLFVAGFSRYDDRVIEAAAAPGLSEARQAPFDPEALAAEVDAPDFGDPADDAFGGLVLADDMPAAAGLGQRGASPAPLPVEPLRSPMMSFSGDLDDFSDFADGGSSIPAAVRAAMEADAGALAKPPFVVEPPEPEPEPEPLPDDAFEPAPFASFNGEPEVVPEPLGFEPEDLSAMDAEASVDDLSLGGLADLPGFEPEAPLSPPELPGFHPEVPLGRPEVVDEDPEEEWFGGHIPGFEHDSLGEVVAEDEPAPPHTAVPTDVEPELEPEPVPGLLASPEAVAASVPPETFDEPVAPVAAVGAVALVDDDEAQFELGRPVHLVLVGWAINGEYTCGNHAGADIIIPENRIEADQTFSPVDYFIVRVRGRRSHLDVLTALEVLVDEAPSEQGARYEALEQRVIEVIRRDEVGEPDFAVRMGVVQDSGLPDPRARLLAVDAEDELVAPLFTRGLPKGQDRRMSFGPLEATFHFDGETIAVSDFLASYQTPAGNRPFFVRAGGGARYQTAPEDGATFRIAPGDRIVAGLAVYEVVLVGR